METDCLRLSACSTSCAKHVTRSVADRFASAPACCGQVWKRSLPERIWGVDCQDDGPSSASSIALLHYAFYNSMSKVHMAVVHLGAVERSEAHEIPVSDKSRFEFEIKKAWSTSAICARDIIAIAANLPPQPFFQVWYVSLFLHLLSY